MNVYGIVSFSLHIYPPFLCKYFICGECRHERYCQAGLLKLSSYVRPLGCFFAIEVAMSVAIILGCPPKKQFQSTHEFEMFAGGSFVWSRVDFCRKLNGV